MIPDVETIIECLIAGECSKEDAQRWLDMHLQSAETRGYRQGYGEGRGTRV